MTQQINGTPELKTLGDVWKLFEKHGLEGKYCPHCDQFAQARVIQKQDELISDMCEALKVARALLMEAGYHTDLIDQALAKTEER